MPATLDLALALPPGSVPGIYPARIHGAACTFLGHPPPGGRPRFSAWPVVDAQDAVRWRLGWLAADACPRPPSVVMFGEAALPVLDHAVVEVGFAGLAAGPPVGRARIEVVSPMFFSHSGRDIPVPDAERMLRSVLDRWALHAPDGLRVPEHISRSLLDTVYVAEFSGGTSRGAVGARTWQTGFTGTVTLALTRKADTDVRATFAAMIRYAAVAGIGAQTAHGFGAVRTTLVRNRPGTDQPVGARKGRGARK